MSPEDYGPLLTTEAFLEIDLGERIKAELAGGLVKPVVRGPVRRVEVATNLLALIHQSLRGTGVRVCGPLLMVKTGWRSVRFPDVAVYAKDSLPTASDGDRDLMADPLLAVHVRTMTSAETSQLIAEYQALPSVRAILLVNHVAEVVRLMQRTQSGAWVDQTSARGSEAVLTSLDLVLPHTEIFARD